MEIKKTSRKYTGTGAIASGNSKKPDADRRVDFKEVVAHAERNTQQKALQEIIDGIMEQGKRLARKADLREFKEYRKLISMLLDAVIDNTHKLTKQNRLDRMGRHKIYAVIKKINTEVELIAEELIKNEKDNLRILERIDIIKGLILDLEL